MSVTQNVRQHVNGTHSFYSLTGLLVHTEIPNFLPFVIFVIFISYSFWLSLDVILFYQLLGLLQVYDYVYLSVLSMIVECLIFIYHSLPLPIVCFQHTGAPRSVCLMLASVSIGLDEDVTRDREEHEDREEDKTDQSESDEDDDDNVYLDDSAPPVETPYIKNSTEELGQVCLL